MSKSNSEEIIAILWFILAALSYGFAAGVFTFLGLFSICAAGYYGYKESKKE